MDINGHCTPRFAPVKDVFAANFAAGSELGARFVLVQAGEVVVDLWGGHADRARIRPYDQHTLSPIFSITKAVAGLMIARLIDDGRLAYDQTVASIWPEFAQGGKDRITIEQVLSHQAGLSGFTQSIEIDEWWDRDSICTRLAAMAPLWPPGTASGYHPITIGYLTGEIFRRVDGRSMPQALRDDLSVPFDLDLWIGAPVSEHSRRSELDHARGLPPFGDANAATLAAIRPLWSLLTTRRFDEWLLGENPAANGHATALGLARLMGALADDGRLAGGTLLSPGMIAEATRARTTGADLVLPAEMAWAAGFMRNPPGYYLGPGEAAFGHAGWGGCCAFADPDHRLGGGYLMNKQGVNLVGDGAGRAQRLIAAAYSAL